MLAERHGLRVVAKNPEAVQGAQIVVLAVKPQVLLLDEPLSALDLKLRKEMQIELKRLQTETGITFVFVTHDQEEALTLSDRIAVMFDGRIVATFPTDDSDCVARIPQMMAGLEPDV